MRHRLAMIRWVTIGIAFLPGLYLFLPIGTGTRAVIWIICLAIVVPALVVIILVERKLRTFGWRGDDDPRPPSPGPE